ncbi:hypothetical protein BH20ACT23_BH20ACT23_00100 [soil metagenome]
MDHVLIRKLEHLTGNQRRPELGYAIEMRDRPGPAHKMGAFESDVVWVQLHGGLYVAKARVEICWRGEFSSPKEIRMRVRDAPTHNVAEFWTKRPRFGYAAVAELKHETWVEPFWAGPRSYGYEWVLLENDKKHHSWLDVKDPPRGGAQLMSDFAGWKAGRK